ncbi:sensor histidine kinase [Brevibacterium litoralis]|uniref:sensor histidine kinase n=1 Tax=Brevibacterium litoralis TaxID=3138935 RepID=UPI0032EE971C
MTTREDPGTRSRPRRGISLSLRWKIALLIVVSVLVAVLACGVLVRQSVGLQEDDRVREIAVGDLQNAEKVLLSTGVVSLNATVNDQELPSDVRESALSGRTVTKRGEVVNEDGTTVEVVWAASPVRLGTSEDLSVLSIRSPTESSTDLLRSIDTAILWSMVGAAVVIGGIAIMISGQLSRRLTLGAQAARRIAGGDTSVRISDVIEAGDDEVQALAEAVDSAVQRLRERLDSEQRFTSDLAHEMRTPLTGLVNAANLLEEDSRPAELVRDRVGRLQVLVEDLLEVSRLDANRSQPSMGPMNVDNCLRSLHATLQASGALAGRQVVTELHAGDTVIDTDQRRFERIVSNLVINSIKHGADPVTVRSSPQGVVVSDAGEGYPSDILAHGPSRFVSSGGGGMGLGLVIAQGQANLLGIDITFANGPAGGAETTLTFPTR